MKLVPFEDKEEEGQEIAIPEVSPQSYGELFRAADWAVTNRVWDAVEPGVLFEMEHEGSVWQGALWNEGVWKFQMVRKDSSSDLGFEEQLEVQFLASDFLQGHDYELNVRYAPESWDGCERDVIVLRASMAEGPLAHPDAGQVRLLSLGLEKLEASLAKSLRS